MSATPFDHEDRWTSLIERFVARGAHLRAGNLQQDMIEHLLNCLEEVEVRVKATPKPPPMDAI